MGLGGLEPPTSSLSGKRSNQAELQAHFMGVLRVPEATRLQGLAQNLPWDYIFYLGDGDDRGTLIKIYESNSQGVSARLANLFNRCANNNSTGCDREDLILW